MKFNKIFSLVVSTCLITSPLMAGRTPEPLSDAYNWKGVPAKEARKDWHKKTHGALSKRAEELVQEYKQAESLFAPYTRRGDKRVRTIANAVCDFLEERASRAQYSTELFDGYREEGPTESIRDNAAKMKTPLPTFGRHTDLMRKVAETKAEIEKLQTQIAALQSSMVNRQSSMTDGTLRVTTSEETSIALLGQNLPNPFDNSTIIPFRIPRECHSATIVITEVTGKIVRAIPVSCKETQLALEAGLLAPAAYSYSLVVDGITVDTKQMVLVK